MLVTHPRAHGNFKKAGVYKLWENVCEHIPAAVITVCWNLGN